VENTKTNKSLANSAKFEGAKPQGQNKEIHRFHCDWATSVNLEATLQKELANPFVQRKVNNYCQGYAQIVQNATLAQWFRIAQIYEFKF
jgi:CRISPR/Cas system-associated endoribonuclease Cas2